MPTTVYTDGACLGNPGPGGWAWAVPGGRFASGSADQTTNQRMEITAVLQAVTTLDGPLHVMSDSTYVVNCFRDRWWEGWIARGWLNSQKKPVANRDLWEPLIGAYRQDRSRVTFQWVKGHADDPVNDLVDRLAVEAAREQTGRTGTGTPDDLGAADDPAAEQKGSDATERDRRLPAGRLVLVTGHRPPELGGWSENPVASGVRDKLAEILLAKRGMHADLVVLTGLDLGAEQLAAEACAATGIPYVAVLGWPGTDSVWPDATRKRFAALREGAEQALVLEKAAPEGRQKVAAAFARRNAFLSRNADEAILVWDRQDSRIRKLAASLEDKLGEDVWILDPGEVS